MRQPPARALNAMQKMERHKETLTALSIRTRVVTTPARAKMATTSTTRGMRACERLSHVGRCRRQMARSRRHTSVQNQTYLTNARQTLHARELAMRLSVVRHRLTAPVAGVTGANARSRVTVAQNCGHTRWRPLRSMEGTNVPLRMGAWRRRCAIWSRVRLQLRLRLRLRPRLRLQLWPQTSNYNG